MSNIISCASNSKYQIRRDPRTRYWNRAWAWKTRRTCDSFSEL